MPAEGSGGPGLALPPDRAGETQMSGTSRNTHVDEERLAAITHGAAARVAQGLRDRGAAPVAARPHARDRADAHPTQPPRRGATAAEVPNPPSCVYDTTGPYTDPRRTSTCAKGCPSVRGRMDSSRAATSRSWPTTSSAYGRARRADATLDGLRFHLAASRCVAKAGRNVTQMHYARRGHHHPGDGVRRHPREPASRGRRSPAQHPGRLVGRRDPARHHPGVRARRGRARPRDHPRQHQPPRARADDHRPQLPGEDQRQHRQLGRHAPRSRKRSRRWCGRSAGAPTR